MEKKIGNSPPGTSYRNTLDNEKNIKAPKSPHSRPLTPEPQGTKLTRRDLNTKNAKSHTSSHDVLIGLQASEDHFIEWSTLMDQIGVPKKNRSKVSGHVAWKKMESQGRLQTTQDGQKLLTRGMGDKVLHLFRTLLKENQFEPAYDLLSRCEASSRIMSLLLETRMFGRARDIDPKMVNPSLLQELLEQTAVDLAKDGLLQDLEEPIRLCNIEEKASIAAKLLLEPLLPFSRQSSVFGKLEQPFIEKAWQAALKMANASKNPASALQCLAHQCSDLDSMVNKGEIKLFNYRESIAEALDNLPKDKIDGTQLSCPPISSRH